MHEQVSAAARGSPGCSTAMTALASARSSSGMPELVVQALPSPGIRLLRRRRHVSGARESSLAHQAGPWVGQGQILSRLSSEFIGCQVADCPDIDDGGAPVHRRTRKLAPVEEQPMSFYRGMTCENVTISGDKGTPVAAYVAKPSG